MSEKSRQKIEFSKFGIVFAKTLVITLILTCLTYIIADALDVFPSDLEVSGLGEFSIVNVITMTLIGNLGAAAVFMVLSKIKTEFINTYYILSVIMFIIYFMLPFQGFVYSNNESLIVIQIMHVLVAGPIVYFYQKFYNDG